MGIINFFINLLKDPRTAIASWISMGVAPTLGFIFLIVFVETGVVFFPFLPGDSLLFAAGFFAAPDAQTGVSALPLFALLPVVWCAPIIGDQCNYWIGHFFGRRIIESGRVNAFKYRLCALPIGVNILPTFAPTVINVPTSTACSSM